MVPLVVLFLGHHALMLPMHFQLAASSQGRFVVVGFRPCSLCGTTLAVHHTVQLLDDARLLVDYRPILLVL